MRRFETVIPLEFEGRTVETVLRRLLGLSPTRIKRTKFLPEGILLDGQRVFTNHPVRGGQTITVNLPELEENCLLPTEGEVKVVYEDSWLLCVDKPAGLAVHPGPGHYADTLGNRLSWLFEQRGESIVFRPVNRLDIGTSGLMLVAKSAQSHEALQTILHTDDFRREYLALTTTSPHTDRGRIDAPIGAVEGELNKYYVTQMGKHAVTEYEMVSQKNGLCLLRLALHTGRTHQIRVHMAYLGCPLLGDKVYGGRACLDRPALHSHYIRLKHPFSGHWLDLRSPLPEDMRGVLG